MREHLLPVLTLAALLSGTALADTVTVVKHGLSCASPEALAKLTRPDGSSLVDGQLAPREAMQIATQGGCSHLQIGQTFTANSIRKNTTVVMADAGDGQGTRPYYLPNIDLSIHRDAQGVILSQVAPGSGPGGVGHPAETAAISSPAAPPVRSETPSAAPPSPPSEPGMSNLSIDGIKLGDSEEQARAILHRDWFIKHVTGDDPAIKYLYAGKTDSTDRLSVETLNGKVILIHRRLPFGIGGAPRPLETELQQQTLQRYGQPNGRIRDPSNGWLFEYTYNESGARQPDIRGGCSTIPVRWGQMSKQAADEPANLQDYVLSGYGAGCDIFYRVFSNPTALDRTVGDYIDETLYEDDSLRVHLMHHDVPSAVTSSGTAAVILSDGDELPGNVKPSNKTYSAGGIKLGESAAQVKARMASGFTEHDGFPGVEGEGIFSLDRNDKQERFIIQTTGDTIVAITHDQLFPAGSEPLSSAILDLAVSNFGPQRGLDLQSNPSVLSWSIGRDGQETPDNDGCGGVSQAVNVVGTGRDIGPLSEQALFATKGQHGCTFGFSVERFFDQTDPKLVSGLRTTLIDEGRLIEFVASRAKSASDARSQREKAAAAAKTSL